MLSQKREDALTETMNISIGKAANLLSEMLDKKINLKIPRVELISLAEAKQEEFRLEKFPLDGHLLSSKINFGKGMEGAARLVFPIDQSKLLINLCLGEEEFNPDVKKDEFTDVDFDVVREVGNVILNSIVGGLGNLVENKIEYTLPKVEMVSLTKVERNLSELQDNYLLLIYNNFVINETIIEGSILLVLSISSIESLLAEIDKLVSDFYEE